MEEKQQTFDFFFVKVLKLIVKHYKFVLGFIIISLVFVLLISFLIPHRYEVKATLLPPEEIIGGGLREFLQSFSNVPLFGSTRASKIQLYYEMLKSRELAKTISKHPEFQKFSIFSGLDSSKLVKLIYKSINVDLKQSGLFVITGSVWTGFFPSSSQKKEAAKAVASLVQLSLESLDTLVHSRISSRAKRKRVLIENLLKQKKDELTKIELELENFSKANRIIGFESQSQAILTSAIQIGSELSKAEIEYQILSTEYEPNSPIIRTLKEKINKLREQYQKVQSGGLTGTEAFALPLEKLPSLARQYASLVREQKILEQVNIFLETLRYQETIQEETEIPAVDVLDVPTVPTSQVFPNRPLLMLFTLLFSSIIAVSIVVIKYYKRGELG
ncbi:MAG: hypothetical protein N2517_08670 [Ignavibacteria bacterium]|nr:hypothetical protein [Ignavibacteria bacterium]